jgi:hypothetical protein
MPRKGNSLSEPNFQKKIPPRHQGQKGQGQRYEYQRDSSRVILEAAKSDVGKSKSGKADSQGQGQGQRHGQGGGPGKSAYSANALVAVDDGKLHPSLLRVLVRTYWVPFLMGQVLYLVYTLLQFVNPMVLK